MPLISFRNIKLFKGASASPKRPPRTIKEIEKGSLRKWLESPIPPIIVFALLLTWILSATPSRPLPALKEGQIAGSDVFAPADAAVVDTESSELRKREAENAVLPVFVYNPNVFLNIEDKARRFFALGRESLAGGGLDAVTLQRAAYDRFGVEISPETLTGLIRAGFGADLETALLNILEKNLRPGVILSKSLFAERDVERGFVLTRGSEGEKTTRVSDVLDIRETKERIVVDVNALELTARKKGLLISLSYAFLTPNITPDKIETEARQVNARAGIEPVYFVVRKGQPLIHKGEKATQAIVARITAINLSLRQGRTRWVRFVGALLLFTLLMITLWFYLRSLHAFKTAVKYLIMMGITLLASLLLGQLGSSLGVLASRGASLTVFQNPESYAFAVPFQFGVILFAFLTTNTVALIFAILNSLLSGYLLGGSYDVLIFSLIGGLAAIYGIKFYRKQRRTAALKAGLFVVAPINLFLVITLFLTRPRGWGILALTSDAIMAILGGFLSAGLAFVLLPVYENLFRILTQSKLLELTNSESPLFRQLAIEAPGSYHHSLIVAQLAEKAAEEVGLDALLAKAGALYHDIGKIKMPEYFIENKDKKFDVHKDLTPSMSALVIVNHVKEGIELADKEKLPAEIVDIVEQHHGNSLVRYFYLKAKEKVDPEMEKIGEESYRYPGPTPKTKEAGIVMLADSVEAASRSLRSHKEEHLKRVIRDIFDNYLEDGQLDDCAFSLRELRIIAASFLASLHTIYQPRVEYPGFDFESNKKQKPETPKNGTGGGPANGGANGIRP